MKVPNRDRNRETDRQTDRSTAKKKYKNGREVGDYTDGQGTSKDQLKSMGIIIYYGMQLRAEEMFESGNMR